MKRGDWVSVAKGSISPSQVVEVRDSTALVQHGSTPGDRKRSEHQLTELKTFLPEEGHTLWVPIEGGAGWVQGRFLAESADQWLVKLPISPEPVRIPASHVWMKAAAERPSAIDMLGELMPSAKGEMASRRRFRKWVVEQEAATAGYSAFISSPARPVPHQLSAAARVLADPVRRFLLADEVGLGKTIEAGLVIRQVLQDDLKSTALIVVPESLVDQWQRELRDTLRFGALLRRCTVAPYSAIDGWSGVTVAVVDEAHRPCDDAHDDHAIYPTLQQLATEAPDLLLLSATPLRGRPETLLRMMHLIDPVGYPLTDIDRFAVRLGSRASQAQILRVLRGESSAELTESLIEDLLKVLPSEHGLDDLLNQVRTAPDDVARRAVVDELIVTVQERFRIGRRLIRTSKASVEREHYPVPGRELQVEEVPGLGGGLVDEFVSRWIGLAREHRESSRSHVGEVLTAGLGGALTLMSWITEREASLGAGSRAAFPNELALLHEYVVRHGDHGPYLAQFVSHFKTLFSTRGAPIVVAVSRTDVASTLLTRLRERFGPNLVSGYLATMSNDERRMALDALHGKSPPRVFVIDKSAEEGCNLQVARSIINVDLPWDVNRLEQRLGRLDRYAPGAAVKAQAITVIDPECELQRNQLAFLITTGVFSESVATIQRGLSTVTEHMTDAVLDHGVAALLNGHQGISELLDEDRRDTELLEYLESSTAFGALPAESIERLIALDEEWGKGQRAIDRLTDKDGGYHLRRTEFVIGGQVFKYSVTGRTTVTGPLRQHLAASVGAPVTMSRPLALLRSEFELLRVGHRFIDLLSLCVEFDERGRAEIRWWHVPSAVEETKRFVAEVRVEWNVDPNAATPETVRAAQRRLWSVLPKQIIELTVDGSGEVVDPVDDWFADGSGERMIGVRAVRAAAQIGQWRTMVDAVEDGVRVEVRRRLQATMDTAVETLAKESDKRQTVLAATDPIALAEEVLMADLLAEWARRPRIHIESVQAHIRSPIKV